MARILNIQPSPPDNRDWWFRPSQPRSLSTSETLKPLPPTFSLIPELLPVRDQGSQGTCAAHVAATMKEWQELKEIGLDRYLSPQFIYNCRDNQSEGMYGRNVMEILRNLGVCVEALYPYHKIEPMDAIEPEVFERALNHRIRGYARLDTMQSLKQALMENGPCYTCFQTYNTSTTMWRPPSPDAPKKGGHAMTFVGWNREGFILRNSWGIDWGREGYCTFPYEDWDYLWEVWTVLDAPSNPNDDDRKEAEPCDSCTFQQCALL